MIRSVLRSLGATPPEPNTKRRVFLILFPTQESSVSSLSACSWLQMQAEEKLQQACHECPTLVIHSLPIHPRALSTGA